MKKPFIIMILMFSFLNTSYGGIGKITKIDLPYKTIHSNLVYMDGKVYFFDTNSGFIEYDTMTKKTAVLLGQQGVFEVFYINENGQKQVKSLTQINTGGKYSMFLSGSPGEKKLAICMSLAGEGYAKIPFTIFTYDVVLKKLNQVVVYDKYLDVGELDYFPDSDWLYAECAWVSPDKIVFCRTKLHDRNNEVGFVNPETGLIKIISINKKWFSGRSLAKFSDGDRFSFSITAPGNKLKVVVMSLKKEKVVIELDVPYVSIWMADGTHALMRGTKITQYDLKTKKITELLDAVKDDTINDDKAESTSRRMFEYFTLGKDNVVYGLTNLSEIFSFEFTDKQ